MAYSFKIYLTGRKKRNILRAFYLAVPQGIQNHGWSFGLAFQVFFNLARENLTMLLSKKVTITVTAVTFLSLLVATTYASRFRQSAVPPPALGIEISLAKPFYIPAATSNTSKKMSAVVRTLVGEVDSGREITAVKLAPVMEGDKVKVTVYALLGDADDIRNIKSCKDWDSLKSVDVGTYTVGLDEEVSITKLRDYGIRFENGDLTFRVVPKKVFPQHSPLDGGGDCGCASCGGLQCCPNPGYCIGCGECGQACCNGG
jgi:hypothetical protein